MAGLFNPSTDAVSYDPTTGDYRVTTLNLTSLVASVARTVQVSHGTQAEGATAGWNIFKAPTQNNVTGENKNLSITNLLDTNGNNTGWTFSNDNFATASNGGSSTGNNGGPVPDSVMPWLWYNNNTSVSGANGGTTVPTSIYKMSGLNPAKTYKLIIFGSRASTGRISDYIIGGTTMTLDCSNNTTKTVTFTGLVPDTSGNITMTWQPSSGSAYAYINTLQLTENAS